MIYAAVVISPGIKNPKAFLVTPQYTRIDGVAALDIEALPVSGLSCTPGDVVFCAEGINDFAQASQIIFNDNGGAYPLIFGTLASPLTLKTDFSLLGKMTLGMGTAKMVLGDTAQTQLQKIVDQLAQLKNDFAGWVVIPNDGGAALKAKIAAGFALKPDADLSQILSENHKLD